MSDFIEVKIDDKQLQQALKRLADKTSDLTPLMQNIAGIMEDSVEENFEQEGRPKWQKLSPVTVKQRRKKGYWPGRILQMRGELASSITSDYDSNSAIVGTNKKYAAIHQFGGDAGRNKKVKIPARPYVRVGDGESKKIIRIITQYLS